jgi:hypothetical protein
MQFQQLTKQRMAQKAVCLRVIQANGL